MCWRAMWHKCKDLIAGVQTDWKQTEDDSEVLLHSVHHFVKINSTYSKKVSFLYTS